MTHYHPHKDNKGQPVRLHNPSQPSAHMTWSDAEQLATAVPNGPMPATVAGIALDSWRDAPVDSDGWERLSAAAEFDEPPMKEVAGKPPASGAVVVEADGRVWVVSPSNGHGGYTNTFPKGKLDPAEGLSLRANAIKEVYEESGLKVALTGFLCDSVRSTSVTRYYLARRVGGNPAEMGWESQSVHLVPTAHLAKFVTNKNDQAVLEKLHQAVSRPLTRSDILKTPTLTSVNRILACVMGFRLKHDQWPTRVLIHISMVDAIREEVLTPLGWALLACKLELVEIQTGEVIAEGVGGTRYEYDGSQPHLDGETSVTQWIWGLDLID